MKCDFCHKREAKIFVKKVLNDKTEDYNICEVCASQVLGHSINLDDLQDGIIDNVSDMLAGFSDISSGSAGDETVCGVCGHTSSDFQETGRLGCEVCYETFGSRLNTLLKRLQGSCQHTGKCLPGLEKRQKIEELTNEIKKAVNAEEYERAAVLRDRIRRLKKKNSDES
jgi:protein arginine kinase activator